MFRFAGLRVLYISLHELKKFFLSILIYRDTKGYRFRHAKIHVSKEIDVGKKKYKKVERKDYIML